MKKKKKLIRIIICFLLVISIVNPLQVEAEIINDLSTSVYSTQTNYTSSNAKFKTIKSRKRHRSSRSNKSKIKLKKRSTSNRRYRSGIRNKHSNRNIKRHSIISKLILLVIVIFIIIAIVIVIFIKRNKKRFY
ncbi:hypothetical protein [Clostridioides sp. ZZV15-6388]|uniref:hypothetical protein n=1 Tax=unclassified Clostridioides TaxID=2635829 RepID=UPI001D1202F2|nr:hypothetical protein [Clostridioides sp. ZZV15-6388]MCC0666238.1 hypothetical protein [Clostridioides sp. ZZV15-6597]